MTDVYDSSAIRHYKDASFLLDESCLDNAGHLVGFAAECAVKHAIQKLQNHSNPVYDHFPSLAAPARQQFQSRAQFHALANLIDANFLRNWDVNRRYKASGDATLPEVRGWFENARKIMAAAGIKVRL